MLVTPNNLTSPVNLKNKRACNVQATCWDKHIKKILPATNQQTTRGPGAADASFIKKCQSFLLLKFLPSNSFLVQDIYFQNTTKPYNLLCFGMASHLCLINKNLTVYLPESGGQKLHRTETAMKNAFYKRARDWGTRIENCRHEVQRNQSVRLKLKW